MGKVAVKSNKPDVKSTKTAVKSNKKLGFVDKQNHGANQDEKLSQKPRTIRMINSTILQLRFWHHFLLFIYLLTFPCKSLGTTTTETSTTTTDCVCPSSPQSEQTTDQQTTDQQTMEQQTTEQQKTPPNCICPTIEQTDIISTLSEVESSTELAPSRQRKRKRRKTEENFDMIVDDFDQKILQKLPFAKFA